MHFFYLLFYVLLHFGYANILLLFAVDMAENCIVSSSLQAKFDSLNSCDEKVAYLTFDDGPTLSSTCKILDILKDEDVKATFL